MDEPMVKRLPHKSVNFDPRQRCKRCEPRAPPGEEMSAGAAPQLREGADAEAASGAESGASELVAA